MKLHELKNITDNFTKTDALPVLFVGHGNPMNAIEDNEYRRAWQALGQVSYGPTAAEKNSLQFRRSLYVVQDLKAGDVLTRENLRAIRPGLGLPTKYLEQMLGKSVKRDVERGTALDWSLLA